MAFFNELSEKLEAQKIFDSLKGKYETRFDVNGMTYAFLATSIAGGCDDNTSWMLEFENIKSHRIGVGDNDPKIYKAFAEAVDQWVKEKQPLNFYTYGSEIESIKSIVEAVKKKVKGYNLIDDTADQKFEATGETIPGNPVGKITWTKMVPQEAVDTEEREALVSDEFETPYEEPKDIKPNKKYMTYKKDDKLDKGEGSYDLKTEGYMGKKGDSVKIAKKGKGETAVYVLNTKDGSKMVDMEFDSKEKAKEYAKKKGLNLSESTEDKVDMYVKKFKDKMKGSSTKTAVGWVDGIKGISKEDKDKIKKRLNLPVKKEESFSEFKARRLAEDHDSINTLDHGEIPVEKDLSNVSDEVIDTVEMDNGEIYEIRKDFDGRLVAVLSVDD